MVTNLKEKLKLLHADEYINSIFIPSLEFDLNCFDFNQNDNLPPGCFPILIAKNNFTIMVFSKESIKNKQFIQEANNLIEHSNSSLFLLPVLIEDLKEDDIKNTFPLLNKNMIIKTNKVAEICGVIIDYYKNNP